MTVFLKRRSVPVFGDWSIHLYGNNSVAQEVEYTTLADPALDENMFY